MVKLSAEESDPGGRENCVAFMPGKQYEGRASIQKTVSAAGQSGKEALGVPVSLPLTGRRRQVRRAPLS